MTCANIVRETEHGRALQWALGRDITTYVRIRWTKIRLHTVTLFLSVTSHVMSYASYPSLVMSCHMHPISVEERTALSFLNLLTALSLAGQAMLLRIPHDYTVYQASSRSS
jgi:hypothetical protein